MGKTKYLSAFEWGMAVGARCNGLCQELQRCWVFPQSTVSRVYHEWSTTQSVCVYVCVCQSVCMHCVDLPHQTSGVLSGPREQACEYFNWQAALLSVGRQKTPSLSLSQEEEEEE